MRHHLRTQTGGFSRRTFLKVAGAATVGSAVLAGRAVGHGRDDGDILEGQVTLIAEDDGDHPTSIGIELDEAALTDNIDGNDEPLAEVGDLAELEIPDSFPGNFEHIGAWYNPIGHPPPTVYDVPHFDLHCYTISKEEKHTIEGSALFGGTDVPTPLPPDQLPPGYFQDHSVVPEMGLHWFDSMAPEFQGGDFTHTNIYGSYQGDLIFVEPMITAEFLTRLKDGEADDVKVDIATPHRYPDPGFYPTAYSVSYDGGAGEFHIEVTDFEEFEGATVPL